MFSESNNASRIACFAAKPFARSGVPATTTTSFGSFLFGGPNSSVTLASGNTRVFSSKQLMSLLSAAFAAVVLVTSILTLTTSAQSNAVATGKPTISGTTHVGETLTANTDAITDSDGLTSVSYTYQWIRVDDGTDSNITGATNSTYVLTSEDAGTEIKVKVTFTDDANNSEELQSDATDTVVVLLSFGEDEYNVTEGDTVGIVLQISDDLISTYSVPSQLIQDYGDDEYYSLSPDLSTQDLDFGNGTTSVTINFTAADDDVYMPDKGKFGIFLLTHDFGNPPSVTIPDEMSLSSDGVSSGETVIITYINIIEDELDPDANDAATGAPTITGTAQVGETLTAEIGTIADNQGVPAETSFSYQWFVVQYGTETAISGATNKTYTVASSDLWNTLKVKVSFIDNVGYEESVTSLATTSVLPEVPGAPHNLTAKSGNALAKLAWEVPTSGGEPTGYQYRHSLDDGASWTEWEGVTGNDGATTKYKVTGLTDNREYTLQVRAFNIGGYGAESDSVSVVPNIPGLPGAPQNLTATAGDERVTLNWDAPTSGGEPDSYQFRQSEDDGVSWSEWTAVPNSDEFTTEHTVENLTNDQEYSFQIRGVNSGGDGTESATVKSTPFVPDPPGRPSNLTATGGDQEVAMEWDTPDTGGAPERFEYRYKKAGYIDYGDWTPIPDSDGTTTSHTVTGLENGTIYTWEVRGVNRGGDGVSSVDFPTAKPLPPRPGIPQTLTATAGDTQVTLAWTTPIDGAPSTGTPTVRATTAGRRGTSG